MNIRFSFDRLNRIPGLRPVMPRGTMYIMVGISIDEFEGFDNDVDFTQLFLDEESVFVLPGQVITTAASLISHSQLWRWQCFGMDNFVRIVCCAPKDKLTEAFDRIERFCDAHRKS